MLPEGDLKGIFPDKKKTAMVNPKTELGLLKLRFLVLMHYLLQKTKISYKRKQKLQTLSNGFINYTLKYMSGLRDVQAVHPIFGIKDIYLYGS